MTSALSRAVTSAAAGGCYIEPGLGSHDHGAAMRRVLQKFPYYFILHFQIVLPEEDLGILDGWSTEGIFSRGGGGGMAEGAGGEHLGATLGCRVSEGAWTMPGRPLC